jgi:hypothetical protein
MDKKETKKKLKISNTEKTEKKQSKTRGLKPFKPGQSGNPNGRPKGSGYMEQLTAAIKTVEKDKKKKLFDRFVEQAYSNPTIMVALMNKLLANRQHTEIEGLEPLEIIIKRANEKRI